MPAQKESGPGPGPLLVEIVAYAPTGYYQCTQCEVFQEAAGVSHDLHREQVQSSLPADLTRDYQKLSDWVRCMAGAYADRIRIRVIDAASIEGFWKTLRHRIHRYPAIIVDGKRHQGGKDPLSRAEESIARSLRDIKGGVPCSQA